MSTIRELQAETQLSDEMLVEAADISKWALRKIKAGKPVRPQIAGKLLAAFSQKLGREIKPSDVSDLSLL